MSRHGLATILAAGVVALPMLLASGGASAGPLACLNGSTNLDCHVQLDIGNAALAPTYGAGPYLDGHLKLDSVNSSVVHVEFDALTKTIAGVTYQFQFTDLWLNLQHLGDPGVTITASNLSTTPGGATYSVQDDSAHPGNVSSFNTFNLSASATSHPTTTVTQVKFDLTLTGAVWADAFHILELNSDNHSAAGHIFVKQCLNVACTQVGTTIVTGFATWPGPNDVSTPEPATIALFGVGLLGLGALRRRRTA